MFSNIVKGIVTTLIGLLITGASIASVFLLSMTWTQVMLPMVIGAALVFCPDTLFKKIWGIINKKTP